MYKEDATFVAREFYRTMGVIKMIGTSCPFTFMQCMLADCCCAKLAMTKRTMCVCSFLGDYRGSLLPLSLILHTTPFLRLTGAKDGEVPSVSCSRAMFETIARELLLVRQYRVEMLENGGKGRGHEWSVTRKVDCAFQWSYVRNGLDITLRYLVSSSF